jgi:hypothetical protein
MYRGMLKCPARLHHYLLQTLFKEEMLIRLLHIGINILRLSPLLSKQETTGPHLGPWVCVLTSAAEGSPACSDIRCCAANVRHSEGRRPSEQTIRS